MPGITDFVKALWGPSTEPMPQVNTTLAPPLADYPTDADAEYARKYGFGYGRGTEPYVNQEVARVMGKNVTSSPKSFMAMPAYELQKGQSPTDFSQSKNLDLTDPNNLWAKAALENEYAKAALAANRIPIAALGFDPSRIIADVSAGKGVNIGGLYNPNKDTIYANASYPGVMVHEAMHRGIEKLLQAYPEEAGRLLKSMPDDEYIVRYLNKTQGGDPERHFGNTTERSQAIKVMPAWQKEVDRLQEMAQQLIAKNRPRGPN